MNSYNETEVVQICKLLEKEDFAKGNKKQLFVCWTHRWMIRWSKCFLERMMHKRGLSYRTY